MTVLWVDPLLKASSRPIGWAELIFKYHEKRFSIILITINYFGRVYHSSGVDQNVT